MARVLRLLEDQGVVRKRFGLTAEQLHEAAQVYSEVWSLARLAVRLLAYYGAECLSFFCL